MSRDVNKRFLEAMYYLQKEQAFVSVKDFCDQIDCDQAQITYMKKGTRFPTLEMVVALCIVFDVNESFLIRGVGEIMQSHELRFRNLDKRISALEKKR